MVKSPAIRLAENSDWDGLKELAKAKPKHAQDVDDYGMLPLHWASTEKDVPLDVLDALFTAYPAGILQRNNSQLLPLHVAVRAHVGLPWIERLVRLAPETILLPTPNGDTALNLAMRAGLDEECIRFLSEKERNALVAKEREAAEAEQAVAAGEGTTEELAKPALSRQISAPIQQGLGRQSLQPRRSFTSIQWKKLKRQHADEYDEYDFESSTGEETNQELLMSSRFDKKATWEKGPICYICHEAFGWFRHRHHCRDCGGSICRSHIGGRTAMPSRGYTTPQIACTRCYFAIHNEAADISGLRLEERECPSASPEYGSNQDVGPESKPETKDSSLETQKLVEVIKHMRKEMDRMEEELVKIRNENDSINHRMLEQEEIQSKTMLLLTETMTRVSVLELGDRNEGQL